MALCALDWVATPAWGTTRTWTGATNPYWSEPSNWSPAGAPQTGDLLIFPVSAVNYASQNDLADLNMTSILLTGGGYNLTGNDIYLSSDLTDSHSTGASNRMSMTIYFTAAGSVNLTGDQQGLLFDMYGQIRSSNGQPLTFYINAFDGGGQPGYLTLHDAIVTSGQVLKLGNGPLYIRNSNPNICDGGMYFLQGVVYLLGLQISVPSDGRMVIGSNGVYQATVNVGANQFTGDLDIEINNSEMYLNYTNTQIGYLTMREGAVVDGPGAFTVYGAINGNSDSVIPAIKVPFYIIHDPTIFNIQGANYAGLDVQASIGGPGGILMSGNSTLLLEAANSFTGNISISGGILDCHNPGALGSGTNTLLYGQGSLTLRNMSVDGKTLQIQGQEEVTTDLVGSILTSVGECSWGGAVELQTNLVVLGGDLNFLGPISGPGGIDFLNGVSVLGGLTGNTYTGPTVVRNGLLEFNKPSGVNAYAGPLVVGGGAGGPFEARWLNSYQNVGATLTLYANGLVNLNNQNEDFGSVTFNGGEVDTGNGQFAIYAPLTVNPSSVTAVINGNLGLPPGADRVFIVGDGAADPDLQVNAVVFGNPGTYFVKQGAGTMALAGANTFNAPTLLEGGILDVNSGSALGTDAGLIIFNGATLRLGGGGNFGGGFEAVGAGVGGTHGAVEVLPNSSFSFAGGVLLDAATTLNVGVSAGLGLDGPISGTGPLTQTGSGSLVLAGGSANTYSGDTVVLGGTLNLAKSFGVAAVPGNLVLGPGPSGPVATVVGRLLQSGGIGGGAATVNGNSLLDLNGYNQTFSTLNLNDGGSVQTGAGVLSFLSGSSVNVGSLGPLGSHVSASISGSIGLPANAPLTFNVNPSAPFFPFPSGPELDVPASIPVPVENVSFIRAGIVKQSFGHMRLSANNTYAGFTTINAGTLFVDGSQPQSTVSVNSGTLSGTGTIGPIFMNGSSAIVAPGENGPGILNCSNVNSGISASGIMSFALNGTTAGSGYSQLNVAGTVNLAGVTPQWSLGFTPVVGQTFVIISNDHSDAVTGKFNGLPGGNFYIGADQYLINYFFGGKPGNDVAIEKIDAPPSPILYMQDISSTEVQLYWQTNNPNYHLQYTTALTPPSWSADPSPASIVGTNYVVTDSTSNLPTLYRLSVLPP